MKDWQFQGWAGCSLNRVFRVGIIHKMILEQIFEGDEEMDHMDDKGKNSPGKESAVQEP